MLLVEDEAETRNALAVLLRRAGATVTAVDSAAAALEAFAQSRPDVLLSDIGLPEMDGYELLRHLREHEGATQCAARRRQSPSPPSPGRKIASGRWTPGSSIT